MTSINRKRLMQVGVLILVLIALALTVHFGGGWAVDTFKEMHGM
jgi:hypothetical protein